VIAALLGIAVIGVWLLHRRRGIERTAEPLLVVGVLMAAQGLVGSVQYELHLPADMVWVHVALATVTWLALLWLTAAAGVPAPRLKAAPSPAEGAAAVAELPAEEPALVTR
jgi:cytochrome c oxidase assembly protein subunit 15